MVIIIIIVIISFQKEKEPHSPKTSVLFLILEAFLLEVLSHRVCWVSKVLVTIATDNIFKVLNQTLWQPFKSSSEESFALGHQGVI